MESHCNLKATSYQNQCDVMTSHRRRYDVVLTPRAGLDVLLGKAAWNIMTYRFKPGTLSRQNCSTINYYIRKLSL